MKTQIFTIAMSALFTMGFASCSDNETAETKQQVANTKFDKDLEDYVIAQKAVINTMKTRSSEKLSQEELTAMTTKLDSIAAAFYAAHPILQQQIKAKVTDEELEIMKVDTERLLSFVHQNYSADIYNYVYDSYKSKNLICINRMETTAPNLILDTPNELDKVINENLKIVKELGDQTFSGTSTDNKSYSQNGKQEYCLKERERSYRNCEISCLSGYFLTALLGAAFGPASTPSVAISLASTYLEYVNCCNEAERSYTNCLK